MQGFALTWCDSDVKNPNSVILEKDSMVIWCGPYGIKLRRPGALWFVCTFGCRRTRLE